MIYWMVAMYIWAGATLSFSTWNIERISKALELNRKPITIESLIILAIIWPIALPIWICLEIMEKRK